MWAIKENLELVKSKMYQMSFVLEKHGKVLENFFGAEYDSILGNG